MKIKRLLNVGAVALFKGKVGKDLTSLREATDEAERFLSKEILKDKPFSAISVIIYYADITEIFPPSFPLFKRVKGGFLDVEIGLEMKRLQAFAKEGRLTEVFTWALLETLKSIGRKYELAIPCIDAELPKYEKTKTDFTAEQNGSEATRE
jgi:hypothetical protein